MVSPLLYIPIIMQTFNFEKFLLVIYYAHIVLLPTAIYILCTYTKENDSQLIKIFTPYYRTRGYSSHN